MVSWTPKSEEDLKQIIDHISENFNIDLAMEIVYGLIDFVESTLEKNPLAGKTPAIFCSPTRWASPRRLTILTAPHQISCACRRIQ